jgi:hypothetical protein
VVFLDNSVVSQDHSTKELSETAGVWCHVFFSSAGETIERTYFEVRSYRRLAAD